LKKIQPFYYIIGLAAVFMLAGIYLFIMQSMPAPETTGVTVEPHDPDQGGALYDFWFSSAEIYDLSVDHNMTGILFSTDENKISLLDQERRLRWDRSFSTAPKQAKISSCGNFVVAGTEGGLIYFSSTDREHSWENEGLPVNLVALAPNANWIAAARTDEDEGKNYIEFFSRYGEKKWSLESGPVKNLYLSSEYLEQANILFTMMQDEKPVFTAVNLDGEELWAYEGKHLAAVSRHGSRVAAVEGDSLTVYDSQGQALWENELPFEPKTVIFNPQNYNRLLVYGNQEGADENLYYYDLTDDLLWQKRVADGSLFSFTADGQYLVCSSWRHYREDYTQMKILDRQGLEVNSWEVAMRVEKLVKSGHPHLVVVGGEDGYIDLIDLEPLLAETENDMIVVPIYNPVSTEQRTEEKKVTLFFIDENSNLVPVTRSVNAAEDPIQAALEELIRGPARGSALYRTIPEKDVTINVDFSKEEGRLRLDLSPELAELSGAAQSRTALDSLLLTVSAFSEVEEIILTVGEEPLEIFGEELALEQPLSPYRWDKPIYVPVMSGNRYYLKVREATLENDEEADLQHLVEQALLACRSLPFVPSNLDLIELRISREQIQINLSDSFKQIFPDQAGEQEILQSKLVLDVLFMTVFENSRVQRVEILVDGEEWLPPANYPSLSRFRHRPYFINPEQ